MDKRSTDWSSVKIRYDGQLTPSLPESFKLSCNSTIVTIGSCFARNIEEHLNVIGVKLPTYEFIAPYKESTNRPNGILNKFTPSAIKEELNWANEVINEGRDFSESIEAFKFETSGGNVVDLQLNYAPVSEDRFVQRRQQLLDIYKNLVHAECVTITLGLVERWIDKHTGLSVFGAPSTKDLLRNRKRFEFSPLKFAEAKSEVEGIISILRKFNQDVKVLITTSPVPLNKTFKNSDVVVANSYSKSTLRSVCGEICDEFDGVSYFPSFEMVTFRDPQSAFGEDLRHVNDHVVGDVVQLLVDNYFSDVTQFDRNVRMALGDLTAKKKNTQAMLEALSSVNVETVDKNKALILSRVAWRCGQKDLSSKLLKKYFSFEEVDPRDIKALNFISARNNMQTQFSDYLKQILATDPDNERAKKFLQDLDN